MQPILVTTTCEKMEDARCIATAVLEARLAACVQISEPVTSSYWWQEKIETASELVLTMKSVRSLFVRLADCIRAVHPYDVPEIMAVEAVEVDTLYRDWLLSEVAV